jgi:1,2-diacylglycerol 3-alpha-glucosyltransferase
MRIAYLTQSYPPMVSGASLVAKNLAENIAVRGHQVLVIAASDRGESYKSVKDNLTVLRLRSLYNPLRVGQRFLLYPRLAILCSLRDFKPDLIHTHEPLQMGMLSLEHAHTANIPALLSIHQLPWFVSAYLPEIYGMRHVAETGLWTYARWLLRQFNALVTPTQTIARIINTMTGTESQTISYGIDLQEFHPHLSFDEEIATRKRLNLPLKVPIILHVGRLDTDKHVERVIQAAENSLRETEAHLLIVGDGRQKPALMELCLSKGIEQRSHFPGCISVQEGLPAIYRLASLFVTASEIETQGIVLLEAAASGLPVVAVRATCIPEIVHDGVNGYLAKPGDINTLGQEMTSLLKQPEKARSMGTAGRRLVEEHNFQATLDRYEQLYSTLITQKEIYRKKVKAQTYWERAREWMNL